MLSHDHTKCFLLRLLFSCHTLSTKKHILIFFWQHIICVIILVFCHFYRFLRVRFICPVTTLSGVTFFVFPCDYCYNLIIVVTTSSSSFFSSSSSSSSSNDFVFHPFLAPFPILLCLFGVLPRHCLLTVSVCPCFHV